MDEIICPESLVFIYQVGGLVEKKAHRSLTRVESRRESLSERKEDQGG